MSETDIHFDYYYFKQIVDNIEEVYKLKNCFIDLGIRCLTPEDKQIGAESVSASEDEEYVTSDEDFRYFGGDSDTESYDSEDNGFHRIVEHFNRILDENRAEDEKRKLKSKMKSKNSKSIRNSKPKLNEEIEIELKPEPEVVAEEPEDVLMAVIPEESLLEDNFYTENMRLFLSQSMSQSTQTSALVQQIGCFSYYSVIGFAVPKVELLKVTQNVDHLLGSLIGLIDEPNCWPLLLWTMSEDLFAFRKPSKYAILLAHNLLAHYNWSEENKSIESEEFANMKRMHNQFLLTFMTEILLNCYSREQVLEVIAGTDVESDVWTFLSKLIQYLVNESIRKSDDFSLALIHLKLIIDVLAKDFHHFLSESNDYCNDILRIERHQNYRPVVVRLIWSTKSPNYINSVLKQLIFFIVKALRIKNESLLVQLFKLFELSVECLRIGSGNVRPFLAYNPNKSTVITELFHQLNDQCMAGNEVLEKLLTISNVCWIKIQICAKIMAKFSDELKTRFVIEKQISLKLIVECLTNAKLIGFEQKSVLKESNNQLLASSSQTKLLSKEESPRKRSSLGLVTKSLNFDSHKEWTKRNKYGENALHTACIKGQADRLRQLLDQSIDGFGLDPNETDNAGYSPLCEAAINRRVDCIEALIKWQTKSNKKLDFELGPNGQTALHDSIAIDSIECSKLLLESGGIELLSVANSDGISPKDLIKSIQMSEMIESLKKSNNENRFRTKINIRSADDSSLFTRTLFEFICAYVETTRIDRFFDLYQDQWPITFKDVFNREMIDSDVSSLISELSLFRKLPKILSNLKNLFNDSSVDNINHLLLSLSYFDFEN